VEPWTFVKFCYLKPIGWTGFADGESSGVYSVAPLARINAADGMSTPLAQQAYERMINLFGKPVHHTLANHFARVIELVNAAEKAKELSALGWPDDPVVRNMTLQEPREGIGVVEAPRGTLIHHYTTDARGVITGVNLIVATQHNAARIALSVDKAAKALIHGSDIPETMLNRVEMAFRAYDPCNGCATHAFGESAAFQINVRDRSGNIVAIVRRDSNGLVTRS
jgi:F420-non-reducing hydrogenase large subunit